MASGTGNRIVGNRIWSNAGLPIDLGADGPTPNDPGDADDGPNLLVNSPDLAPPLVSTGTMTTTLAGNGRAATGQSGVIEVHVALGCDRHGGVRGPVAYPDGVEPIGVTAVGPTGLTRYRFDMPDPPAWVAATFTDEFGNTSEVGPCVPVHRARIYLPWSAHESG